MQPFKGAHGQQLYHVDCTDPGSDFTTCYERARETCGGNYQVQQAGMEHAHYFSPFPWWLCSPYSVEADRGLVVECADAAPNAEGPVESAPPNVRMSGGCRTDSDCKPNEYCAPIGACERR